MGKAGVEDELIPEGVRCKLGSRRGMVWREDAGPVWTGEGISAV